jgi:hypothetical protein
VKLRPPRYLFVSAFGVFAKSFDMISRIMPGVFSGERTSSTHPLPIGLAGMSGSRAVSTLCAPSRRRHSSSTIPSLAHCNATSRPFEKTRFSENSYNLRPWESSAALIFRLKIGPKWLVKVPHPH